ncbi:hypothetical protein CCICO_06770 [Corynebacterium ciconiae DSM 44920]|uniref:DUF3099 domain-containing protein n=1 Tax=Corynebacterium ciconiae TaxID=227319 RepID=UPI0003780C92|nr:DUF3099 domain-containing protein [Corynebacterium ciconiae]WKD61374.1 hypothetical protein CCICO_06770 [Corynebacterium ciconiae DSM 44920]
MTGDDEYVDEPAEQHSAEETASTSARRSRLQALRRRMRKAELITDARRTSAQNYRHRKTVYAILQGSRIPFLFLSAATYFLWENMVVSGILFVISTLLPWVAVVIANGAGEPEDKRHPRQYKPDVQRAQRAAHARAMEQRSARPQLGPGTGEHIIIDADEN